MSKLNNYQLTNLFEVANEVIEKAGDHKIWTIIGEMGAGKTTLIKKIGEILGIKEDVNSPTFSLVNEYKTTDNNTIYHFDFYRIKTIEEVYDIGIEDYFDSGNICLIEWPEMIAEILKKEKCFNIEIKVIGKSRTIVLN